MCFAAGLHFNGASGARPAAVFRDYQFVPNTMHVPANTSIHLYNDDVIAHTIADDAAGGFVCVFSVKVQKGRPLARIRRRAVS
jgi:hypothetical protein